MNTTLLHLSGMTGFVPITYVQETKGNAANASPVGGPARAPTTINNNNVMNNSNNNNDVNKNSSASSMSEAAERAWAQLQEEDDADVFSETNRAHNNGGGAQVSKSGGGGGGGGKGSQAFSYANDANVTVPIPGASELQRSFSSRNKSKEGSGVQGGVSPVLQGYGSATTATNRGENEGRRGGAAPMSALHMGASVQPSASSSSSSASASASSLNGNAGGGGGGVTGIMPSSAINLGSTHEEQQEEARRRAFMYRHKEQDKKYFQRKAEEERKEREAKRLREEQGLLEMETERRRQYQAFEAAQMEKRRQNMLYQQPEGQVFSPNDPFGVGYRAPPPSSAPRLRYDNMSPGQYGGQPLSQMDKINAAFLGIGPGAGGAGGGGGGARGMMPPGGMAPTRGGGMGRPGYAAPVMQSRQQQQYNPFPPHHQQQQQQRQQQQQQQQQFQQTPFDPFSGPVPTNLMGNGNMSNNNYVNDSAATAAAEFDFDAVFGMDNLDNFDEVNAEKDEEEDENGPESPAKSGRRLFAESMGEGEVAGGDRFEPEDAHRRVDVKGPKSRSPGDFDPDRYKHPFDRTYVFSFLFFF